MQSAGDVISLRTAAKLSEYVIFSVHCVHLADIMPSMPVLQKTRV